MSDEFKRCPFCDEEIRLKALICKHCGQWLPGYSYESAIRDLVLQKQVTERKAVEVVEVRTREEQLQVVLNWAASDRKSCAKALTSASQNLS
ncbi:MAG: hypothetical protein U0401_22345 [Anaerolineae bacterium]